MFKFLLIVAAYLPFQIALNPQPGIDLASIRLIILGWFLSWLVWAFWKKKIFEFNLSWVGLFLALFLFLATFSLTDAANPVWGMRKVVFFGSVFPLYFLSLVALNNLEQVKKIKIILVLGSCLIALIGLFQFLAQFIFSFDQIFKFWAQYVVTIFSGQGFGSMLLSYPSWLVDVGFTNWLRAFSLFSDPHMLSFYLGLLLPLSLSLVFLTRFKKTFVSLSGFLFLALLLAFTRGSYLAVGFSFLVLAVFLWQYFSKKKAALILIGLLFVFLVPGQPFSYRFYTTFDFKEESNVGRLEMWQEATQVAQKNIFLGVGLGNYSVEIEPELGYRNPTSAHNLYLDIFSEIGLFGLIAWLSIFIGLLYKLWLRIKDKGLLYEQRIMAWGLFGSLLYYLAHSIFETSVYHPVILPLLMIILSMSYVVSQKKQSKKYF